MKTNTAKRLAQGIQLLKLDENFDYTNKQLSITTGVGMTTIKNNNILLSQLDYAVDDSNYKTTSQYVGLHIQKCPLFRSHTHTTICDRKQGHFYNTKSTRIYNVIAFYTDGTLSDTAIGSLMKQNSMDGTICKYRTIYCSYGCYFTIIDGVYTSLDNALAISLSLPTKAKLNTFERLALSLGMNLIGSTSAKYVDIQSTPIRDILHTLTMLALKDLSIISSAFNYKKQSKYGEVVFGSYLKAVTGSGRISSRNTYIKWLNEKDTLHLKGKLYTSSGYQVGSNSMIYAPTPFANTIIHTVFDFLLSLDIVHNDIELEHLDFVVDIQILKTIPLRDVMLLLSNCIGYNSGFIIRPTITDRQYSRVYSIFTSISSDTRKLIGYNNYDIGACLQTICLQLSSTPDKYPLHQLLMNDKIVFRTKVMDETGKDIVWVKKELSSADNRDSMPIWYRNSQTLTKYFEEAQILRKDIISNAEPVLLSRAKDMAKTKYKKVWVQGQTKPKFEPNGKKESSIFFFIWTQWERLIRNSMMSCFDNPKACHQVHDAVYSKETIDMNILENRVFEETGFRVVISL